MGPTPTPEGNAAAFRVHDLSRAVARANLRYKLIALSECTPAEREALRVPEEANDGAELLVDATAGTLNVKLVSHRVGRLFQQLADPSVVAQAVAGLNGDSRDRLVARLVLEGVLEIDSGERFVSGCSAFRFLVRESEAATVEAPDRLGRLSIDAIRHAERLEITVPETLAARLYFYNRQPVTSYWRRLWPNVGATRDYLARGAGQTALRDLSARFALASPRRSSPLGNVQWLSWRSRNAGSERTARFKLYVSPDPSAFGAVFPEIAAAAADSHALSLKIGADAYGLLRPDKCVVYFGTRDDLSQCAEQLLRRIKGTAPHGVPFSSSIDETALLSWGVDPELVAGGTYADTSWRIWVCNRLALSLITASTMANGEVSPWRYALANLWLCSVDTNTWRLLPTDATRRPD
jgi:hypothetical protein